MIDFHETKNNSCTKCSKEDRKKNTVETLCNKIVSSDGLPVRCVGGWGRNKINFLSKYVSITGNGMKNKWDRISYVEICSGPGRSIDKEDGMEFDGSPLAVLQTTGAQYFHSFIFIDNNEKVLDVLKKRISNHPAICTEIKEAVKIERGDYNNAEELYSTISQYIHNGLVIIFIDPTDLSVPFSTIVKLMDIAKADFIINTAIYMDYTRNAKKPYQSANSKSRYKYQNAIGDDSFFDSNEYESMVKNNDNQALRILFRKRLKSKFKEHEYKVPAEKKIGRYYHLLFASRDDKGKKFWEEACNKDLYGQKEFRF